MAKEKRLTRAEKRALREKARAKEERSSGGGRTPKSQMPLKKGMYRVTVHGTGVVLLVGGKFGEPIDDTLLVINHRRGGAKVESIVQAENVQLVAPEGIYVKGTFVLREFYAKAMQNSGSTMKFKTPDDEIIKVNTGSGVCPQIDKLIEPAQEAEDGDLEGADEEEPRKKKRPAAEDDDPDLEDEPAPKKKRPAEDEEEEEPAPKKRRPDPEEEEEEPAPKKKRPPAEDDGEEEEPAPKKKRPAEEEEEEPAPKKKKPETDNWDF